MSLMSLLHYLHDLVESGCAGVPLTQEIDSRLTRPKAEGFGKKKLNTKKISARFPRHQNMPIVHQGN